MSVRRPYVASGGRQIYRDDDNGVRRRTTTTPGAVTSARNSRSVEARLRSETQTRLISGDLPQRLAGPQRRARRGDVTNYRNDPTKTKTLREETNSGILQFLLRFD